MDQTCPRKNPTRETQGPNESKLSDRPWRSKTKLSKRDVPPWPVRWSAWLGPRLQSALWTAGTTDVDSGGGTTGAAAGMGRSK